MKQRPCYSRNLGKPIMLFGLELEELAMLLVWVGICVGIFNVFVALFTAIGFWIVLVRTKQGRPPGYLTHFLYFHLNIPLKGFLPSPKKIRYYTAWNRKEENSSKFGPKAN